LVGRVAFESDFSRLDPEGVPDSRAKAERLGKRVDVK
jgi:hypothetical protein